jgi:hypothetical protein
MARKPAFSVSVRPRDDPLVAEMYDDDDDDDDVEAAMLTSASDGHTEHRAGPEPEQAPSAQRSAEDDSARDALRDGLRRTDVGIASMEPAFDDRQQFKKVPAGGPSRSRPPQVLESMSSASHRPTPSDLPRVPSPSNGAGMDGLASVGLVLMQIPGQAPVVADLTPKGLEMSDVAKYVRTGDRVVEVNGVPVPPSMPVAEVEKLLAGVPGSAATVRLLRFIPGTDIYLRKEMSSKKPDNEECDEGVMYYINAVRWCPYLGQIYGAATWSAEDKQVILARPPPPPKPASRATYTPNPLEAPQRATRSGLVYTKGQGFGLPSGSGWELPHALAASPSKTASMRSQSMRSQSGRPLPQPPKPAARTSLPKVTLDLAPKL